MTEGDVLFQMMIAGIATWLTAAMFTSRNSMLGFATAGWWFIFGGYNYQLKTVANVTDIHYALFWFSCVGMTIFCSMAAFGLREVKDTEAESDADTEPQDPEQYPDEAPEGTYDTDGMDDGMETSYKPSKRVRDLRSRAADRHSGGGSKWQKH